MLLGKKELILIDNTKLRIMISLSQATEKLLQHSRNEDQKPANQSVFKRYS